MEQTLWRLKADYFLEVCRLFSFTGISLAEKLEGLKNEMVE